MLSAVKYVQSDLSKLVLFLVNFGDLVCKRCCDL